jgi:hypothetical protein
LLTGGSKPLSLGGDGWSKRSRYGGWWRIKAERLVMTRRRLDPRAVSQYRSYSVTELAACFGVHKNTVGHWQLAGLKPNDDGRPYLFQGGVVRAFLMERNASRKRPCEAGTFYCFRCRDARPPALGMVEFVAKIAKLDPQGHLRGVRNPHESQGVTRYAFIGHTRNRRSIRAGPAKLKWRFLALSKL